MTKRKKNRVRAPRQHKNTFVTSELCDRQLDDLVAQHGHEGLNKSASVRRGVAMLHAHVIRHLDPVAADATEYALVKKRLLHDGPHPIEEQAEPAQAASEVEATVLDGGTTPEPSTDLAQIPADPFLPPEAGAQVAVDLIINDEAESQR